MHSPELFQTNQTELKSDKNLGRRNISCELWTDDTTYATWWHKLILGLNLLQAEWAKNQFCVNANTNSSISDIFDDVIDIDWHSEASRHWISE